MEFSEDDNTVVLTMKKDFNSTVYPRTKNRSSTGGGAIGMNLGESNLNDSTMMSGNQSSRSFVSMTQIRGKFVGKLYDCDYMYSFIYDLTYEPKIYLRDLHYPP